MKCWIARDENEQLHLFSSKPEKIRTHFGDHYADKWEIDEKCFPEVTFENSPQEVEIILSDEYKRLKEIETILFKIFP